MLQPAGAAAYKKDGADDLVLFWAETGSAGSLRPDHLGVLLSLKTGEKGADVTKTTVKAAPNALDASFDGSHEAGSIPSDSNAAVGLSQIVEVVNLQISVYDKSGNLQCAGNMNSFLGSSDSLSDPRVQYDATNDRFSMSITVVAASSTATPALWVAATQSGNPCAGWFVYRVTFGGTGYPAGTTLDYPYLGQDAGALMLSSNNFCCRAGNSIGGGIGSFAFTIPKSDVYNGLGFSFGSTQVGSSTAPVSAADIPGQSPSSSYWLASLPGTGYDLFSMPVGGGTISLQARISAPFNAPSRLVNQPGTNVTLDPLDGRIQWSPVNGSGSTGPTRNRQKAWRPPTLSTAASWHRPAVLSARFPSWKAPTRPWSTGPVRQRGPGPDQRRLSGPATRRERHTVHRGNRPAVLRHQRQLGHPGRADHLLRCDSPNNLIDVADAPLPE